MNVVRAILEEHGGVAVIVTHPVYPAEGRGEHLHECWQNTVICRDGFVRALSTKDEDDLSDLPFHMRAEEHIRVNEDGSVVVL